MIGYMIEQELGNLLPFERPFATLLTMVEVDPDDPAFQNPTKFIGPVYGKSDADRLAAEKGWVFKQDGDKWRRVVASPDAQAHLRAAADQVAARARHDRDRRRRRRHPDDVREGPGPQARRRRGVIDKDLCSELLARELDADLFVMADRCRRGLRRLGQARRRRRSAAPRRRRSCALQFPAGSMGPKVEAACRFAAATGKRAAIGALADLAAIVRGKAGTTITKATMGVEWAA